MPLPDDPTKRNAPEEARAASADELRSPREEIARGLRRSHQTTGIILLVIVALSIVAVSQGIRSERSAPNVGGGPLSMNRAAPRQ